MIGILNYKILISLPLVLLLLPGSGLGCPKECTCNQRSVDCSSGFLWDIPQNIPAETISLNLAYNNLTILPDDAFQTLPSLVTLLVHNSAVETLEPDAFRGLSVLGLLDLHNNRISHLHPGLFRHNPALSTLNLSGNRIRNMIGGIFSQNPVLSQVYLTGNSMVSTVNWLKLGSFTSLSLGPKFCEPSYSLNRLSPTSKMFDSIGLDRSEFIAIGVTNIIVYNLNNMTWAVLETPGIFPVLCFCSELSMWILCGQDISARTICANPWTISEIFANIKCEYLDIQQHFTSIGPTKKEVQDEVATIYQDQSSTSQTPEHKLNLIVDRNLLVVCLAIAGVLFIMWVVAYLVFFHGKRKKLQRDSPSKVSSSFHPGGSPLSLPENVAFNPVAATPDMLLTVNRDHIVYSSLSTIEPMSTLRQHLYSEVQDRKDICDEKN